MGSIRGAIVGALLLSSLPELLRGFDQYRMLAFGLAMILMMRLRPQGLFGSFQLGTARPPGSSPDRSAASHAAAS